jgi:hypothetical protein
MNAEPVTRDGKLRCAEQFDLRTGWSGSFSRQRKRAGEHRRRFVFKLRTSVELPLVRIAEQHLSGWRVL